MAVCAKNIFPDMLRWYKTCWTGTQKTLAYYPNVCQEFARIMSPGTDHPNKNIHLSVVFLFSKYPFNLSHTTTN